MEQVLPWCALHIRYWMFIQKILGSRQQCSSGKIKKEGIRLTTFKNIVYRELLWNGCHFHARKKFLSKGRKLVPPVRTSIFAQACKLCLVPNLSLYSAGSTDGEFCSALSTAHSLSFFWKDKAFQMGRRRGHHWELQCNVTESILKNIPNNIIYDMLKHFWKSSDLAEMEDRIGGKFFTCSGYNDIVFFLCKCNFLRSET